VSFARREVDPDGPVFGPIESPGPRRHPSAPGIGWVRPRVFRRRYSH
jgi:hypothetical protein